MKLKFKILSFQLLTEPPRATTSATTVNQLSISPAPATAPTMRITQYISTHVRKLAQSVDVIIGVCYTSASRRRRLSSRDHHHRSTGSSCMTKSRRFASHAREAATLYRESERVRCPDVLPLSRDARPYMAPPRLCTSSPIHSRAGVSV